MGKKQIQVDTDIAVSLQKDGKDTLQVKSHVEKNNFVVEVIKNNVSNVYSYPLQKVKGDQS